MSKPMLNVGKVCKANTSKNKLFRCVDWLQDQNSLNTDRLSQQNKNDIQFIIQTNAARKKFLLSTPEDDATVPAGVDEQPEVVPKAVARHHLRVKSLQFDCQWTSCGWRYTDYELFQKHVQKHSADLHVIDKESKVEYVCLWDVCGHNTSDFLEMVRHINYHAYHARLMAIGFNARATLKLARCDKDSTKRNHLPPLKSEHCCLWTGCDEKFNSIQDFFDHVKVHIMYAEGLLCSWAGCGVTFSRRILLTMHVRSHTGERLIACYHCGQHFACNRKLCDHLRRQNPSPTYTCSVCGAYYASDYLLREHTRQHVSMYACAQCDMSAPTPAALAMHVRYRHLPATARHHACPHCPYRAVNISDLRKHTPTHTRKRKRSKVTEDSELDMSDDSSEVEKQTKPAKKYACHMCPEKSMKVFSRGSRLTTHLVQVHGVQWPFGHSRFRSNKYLQKSAITRVCAVGGFFISIPVFLTGIILYTFIQFHSTPAIVTSVFIGVGIVFCGCAMVHNVFVWQKEKTNLVKALRTQDANTTSGTTNMNTSNGVLLGNGHLNNTGMGNLSYHSMTGAPYNHPITLLQQGGPYIIRPPTSTPPGEGAASPGVPAATIDLSHDTHELSTLV